jgi:transcriptional regulator with XRE-family HTH domain
MRKNIKSVPVPHLQEWRLFKSLTQTELGQLASVTHTSISNFENGVMNPSFQTIRRLSEAMGISVEQLRYERPPIHQDFAMEDNTTQEEAHS